MADILRGYGLARESAFFKQEQEAEIQRHRRKMVKEGKLPAEAEAPAKIRREMTLTESAKAYEVEPTILQQGARIDDPHAAAKREYERRRKASLPALSPAEVAQHTRRAALRGDSLVGVVPRVDLRRNRYNAAALYEAGAAAKPLPPIVAEAAGRAYSASLRAVGYGSLLTLTSISLLAAYTLQQHGITDTQALRCVELVVCFEYVLLPCGTL